MGGRPPEEPSAEIDDLIRRVLHAAVEVHRCLGPGHLERTYEEALVLELRSRGEDVRQQVAVPVRYKGTVLRGSLRIDVLVGGLLVVEVKAVDALHPIHAAQVLAYLRAIGGEVGLLLNFNVPLLKQGMKRIINAHRMLVAEGDARAGRP